MKKYFILALFCVGLFMFSCDNKTQGQLTGKWQKSDNPDVVIEFKTNDIYEITMKGEKCPTLNYRYQPDASDNNLQIGEGRGKLNARLEFVQKDKIRIIVTKPYSQTTEYEKIS